MGIQINGQTDIISANDGSLGIEGLNNLNVNTINNGPLSGARNRIINGDMRIDQRNNGSSVTLTASFAYNVDRWGSFEDSDGGMTVQRSSTAPTGFSYSLLHTVTSSDSSLAATQRVFTAHRIEGLNSADFEWGTANAKTVTLSFWVQSSLTGNFGGAIKNGTSTRSYPFQYAVSAVNTWEYKTITIPGDTSGTWATDDTTGITISFGLGVGSTFSGTAGSWVAGDLNSATGAVSVIGTNGATFYITGVQLEIGPVATPFERRTIGTELALSQRYYQKSTTDEYYQFPTASATQIQRQKVTFPVQMRISPSVTRTRTGGTAGTTVSADGAEIDGFRSGFSGSAGHIIYYSWTSSAEL